MDERANDWTELGVEVAAQHEAADVFDFISEGMAVEWLEGEGL